MVVPDVISFTSVADNFNAGCVGFVDGLCTLSPAIRVAGCLNKKLDICQHVRIYIYILPLFASFCEYSTYIQGRQD